MTAAVLWFDVGIKRYTTFVPSEWYSIELWFDVGIKRYTTRFLVDVCPCKLWFDVGIKRYTTRKSKRERKPSCGLM